MPWFAPFVPIKCQSRGTGSGASSYTEAFAKRHPLILQPELLKILEFSSRPGAHRRLSPGSRRPEPVRAASAPLARSAASEPGLLRRTSSQAAWTVYWRPQGCLYGPHRDQKSDSISASQAAALQHTWGSWPGRGGPRKRLDEVTRQLWWHLQQRARSHPRARALRDASLPSLTSALQKSLD